MPVVKVRESHPGYHEYVFVCGHIMSVKDTDPTPERCPERHTNIESEVPG